MLTFVRCLISDDDPGLSFPWASDSQCADRNQIGTSFGLTITTIVFDKIVARNSLRLGYRVTNSDAIAPPAVQLSGYRSAQWTVLAFALFCESVAWFSW